MNTIVQSNPPYFGALIAIATSLASEKLLPYGAITFTMTADINSNTSCFSVALFYAVTASV